MAVANRADDRKKGGFLNRFKNIGKRFNYFRDVWNELKKVHWPDKMQLLTYTGVVLVSVGIIAFLIWIVDSSLSYVMNILLG
ncbi:MAG: preprotein translocase subunit SecE [Peptococcaceae bacterium]|jgi:preprotein translocase subunit SecE|nr:preprotein translocase subunit SecE [Peptococcaceae bacterium]